MAKKIKDMKKYNERKQALIKDSEESLDNLFNKETEKGERFWGSEFKRCFNAVRKGLVLIKKKKITGKISYKDACVMSNDLFDKAYITMPDEKETEE